ncbi:hypothetical protein PHLGIDRAFT_358640 [Phlebiopsis gigantea 11061_1 CR5-6]|uniref:Uncharacterized protein n=1 Tax=Phlebiopsis gigantea (strain 11061_1 CR5-6) TaxID=745531 RepID=A0A0C3SCK4_PHLG1|nr:hypothetical protein PHLGIDRAFT_358640 [Phlebiopsis gigantea 11061_1 CR5-6]
MDTFVNQGFHSATSRWIQSVFVFYHLSGPFAIPAVSKSVALLMLYLILAAHKSHKSMATRSLESVLSFMGPLIPESRTSSSYRCPLLR